MFYKPSIDQTLQRYRDFWKKRNKRVPFLLRIAEIEQIRDEYFTNPAAYLKFYEDMFAARIDVADDYVPTASLDLGAGFTGGLLGGEVTFDDLTSWSDHPLDSWDKLDTICWNFDCKWGRYFDQLMHHFCSRCEGRYAVGLRIQGPTEYMAALRNPTDLCVDVTENPERFHELARRCTDAYKRIIAHQMDAIPPLAGGYCDYYSMWMPGRSAYFTTDFSGVFSPAMYKEHLFQYDQEYALSVDSTWVHVHSGGETHQVENFLQLKNVLGIQIVNDFPAGPPLADLAPLLKQIQKTHCLILRKFPLEELRPVLRELSPSGLFLDIPSQTVGEAKEIADHWDDICRDVWKG